MSRLSRRKFFALSGATVASAALGRAARACPVHETDDGHSLVAGNTSFGADLYARLRQVKDDVFLSPFSISTALAMTAAGAKGKTFEEMANVLHLPESKNPHEAFGSLLAKINRNTKCGEPAYQLSTVNALWAQQGLPWKKDYIELTQKHYEAGLLPTDFGKPEDARLRINGWVEKETKEKIKNLIPQGVLSPLTKMVLTNAIYFKSAWLHQFKPFLTQKQPFLLADGTKADVDLMSQMEHFAYHETEDLQVVELPYARNELAMVIVLPRKPDGLPKVEEKLTADTLTEWKKSVKEANVALSLPRFTIVWDKELKPILMAMGMQLACGGGADFTGMLRDGTIFITNVIHKTFVAVDEAGTEAAASTAVVLGRPSAPPPKPVVFRADRPFLFAIRENTTGSILFLGRYTGPK